MKPAGCFPGSITVVDITGQDTVETGLVWEDGDADRSMKPVPGTLVKTPWAGENAAQFLVDFYELDGTPHDLDPRHVLGLVVDRYAEQGLVPAVAVELEFYLVDPKRSRDGLVRPAAPAYSKDRPRNVEVYGLRELEDFRPFPRRSLQLLRCAGAAARKRDFRIRAGAVRTDALLQARCAARLRRCHHVQARGEGRRAASRAGGDLHGQALCRSGGQRHAHPCFDQRCGWQQYLRQRKPRRHRRAAPCHWRDDRNVGDSFALFAPNANSYRRFKANSYAPVAPTWGVNNRTVSFRIPAGAPKTRHVEHRACGADANPYLAVAAVLAGMHHGMANQTDPGPAVVGNGYDRDSSGDDKPPSNWFAAVDRFHASSIMRDYLGERFVDMYSIVKRVEQDRYFSEVPRLDYDWYLRNA
jgi:glutamine synthetase